MNKLTQFTEEEIACPKCGKKHTYKRYAVVNVTEKPELKDMVLRNRLFVFTCDECGLTAPLTYESVYVDSKKNMILYLAPQMTKNTQAAIEQWEQIPAKKKRLVDNLNDLKEKIVIADNQLDDAVIEFMKIENLKQLEKEMKDDKLLNILFDYQGAQFYFVVFFEKKGVGRIPVSTEYYRGACQRYAKHLPAGKGESFRTIDMKWAGDQLFLRN